MARKTTPKTGTSKPKTASTAKAKDPVVIEGKAVEVDAKTTKAAAPAKKPASKAKPAAASKPATSSKPAAAAKTAPPKSTTSAAPAKADAKASDRPADPKKPAASTPSPAPAAEKGRSPVPMVIGGVLAGAIGFGAAYMLPQIQGQGPASEFRSETESALTDQDARITELADQVNAATGGDTGLDALQADLTEASDTIAALSNRMSDLETQLAELQEATPSGGAAADPALLEQLAALQEAVETQKTQITAMEDAAEATRQQAESAADATLRRAAMTRIHTALDTGAPFADALAELQGLGVDIPEALSAQAGAGIASVTQLAGDFPNVAREALAAARTASAESGEGGSGFSAFLREQLGTRSLTPKEGDDPDAILSRMEAAAKEGRLSDALSEMTGLPEAASTALEGWKAAVESRLSAVSAAQALSDTLN